MYFLYRRISSENMTLREDQDRKTREIADLSDVGKRREEELQRMDQELKRIGQELANANAAKVLYAKTNLNKENYLYTMINNNISMLLSYLV